MNLVDLNPNWVGAAGAGVSDRHGNPASARTGIGISFDCPCACGPPRVYVSFSNPIDGGAPILNPDEPRWHRHGYTFETLTLHPSILRTKSKGGCGWHGWIKNGQVTSV